MIRLPTPLTAPLVSPLPDWTKTLAPSKIVRIRVVRLRAGRVGDAGGEGGDGEEDQVASVHEGSLLAGGSG